MNQLSVAFSGSGFKVPGHVGALKAILDQGNDLVEVAGTSGGSIIAALHATGMTLREMTDLAMEKDWSDLIELNFGSLFRGSYCNGDNLYELMLDLTQGKTFAEADIPLRIVASDVAFNVPMVFSQENTPDVKIALAVRASASIPFVYEPVNYRGRFLVDGGLVNNIPVNRLTKCERKLGIQMHSELPQFDSPANLRWPWAMAARIINLMMTSNENTHIRLGETNGAVITFVETGFAEGLDTNMEAGIRQMLMDNGYNSAIQGLVELNSLTV